MKIKLHVQIRMGCVSNVVFSFRGYSGKKLTDNVQCEIFQTILEEALDNYAHSIVHELESNSPEDFERNVDAIGQFVTKWTCDYCLVK